MAGGKVPEQAGINPLDIAALLGGQKTSVRSNANTAGLQQVLAQTLQPADPSAQLAALFQQAGAQIPGLTAARANAVGARTGNNSAVAGSMDRLQQETVLKAQQQIAQQELMRQQIAQLAAANLAQVTRGTTQQQGTNLGRAAGALGVAQGVAKLGDTRLGKKAGDLVSQGFDAIQNAVMGPDPTVTTYAVPGVGPAAFESTGDNALAAFDASSLGSNFSDIFVPPVTDVSTAPIPDFQGDWDTHYFDSLFGMKDGGLVGRDGEPKGYADGGQVSARVGGSRRGTTATYEPLQVDRALARFVNPFADAGVSSDPGATTGSPVGGSAGGATVGDSGTSATSTGSMGQATNVGINAAIGNPIGAMAAAVNNPAVTAAVSALAALAAPTPVSVVNSIVNAISAMGAPNSIADPVNVNDPNAINVSPASVTADGQVGIGDSSGNSVSASDGSAVGTGADAGDGGDGSPGGGYKDGGKIKGPGTGTSDSIPTMLSKGEYVIPADVVSKLGANFFDYLLAKHHTPVQGRNEVPLPGNPGIDTDDDNGDDVG